MATSEGSRRERKKDETRERIVGAAMRLFMEKGFQATAVDEIAGLADVAKGTFFNYFPRKEAVLGALAERWLGQMDEVTRRLLGERGRPRAKILRFVREIATIYTQHRELARIIVGRMIAGPDETAARIHRRGHAMLRSLVEQGIAAGDLRADLDPDRGAEVIRGVAFSTLIHWLAHEEGAFDVLAEIEQRVSLVLDGLLVPERSRTGTPRRRAGFGLAALLAPGLLALALAASGCSDGGTHIHASGTVEMDEIDVASLVGGRVVRLEVEEGDAVQAGDTVAVLDHGEIISQLDAQAAEARRAAALSQEVRTGPRPEEIRTARAEKALAEAELQLAERELTRATSLAARQVIAEADLDRAQAVRDEALARRDAASERLRLLEQGSRREDIEAAKASASAADAAWAAARSRVRELVLVAPVSGVVLLKNFEPGEIAQAGLPLVTLGNPDSLWMRVYVRATEIDRVRLGARAEIHLTGNGGRVFSARVIEIASRAEFTPRAALTEEERANIVFGVKLAIDPNGRALKAGLPADVRILAPPRSAP